MLNLTCHNTKEFVLVVFDMACLAYLCSEGFARLTQSF